MALYSHQIRRRRLWRPLVPAVAATALGAWLISQTLVAGADEVTLSTGKPATASSVEAGWLAAGNAVDGRTDTRWSSAFTDGQWLQVDLGAPADIDRVVLRWEQAYATAYEIQISTDGSAWTTAYATASGDGDTDEVTVDGQARYVRMAASKRATGWGVSLWEFDVYGTPGAAGPTAAPTTPPASTPSTPPPGAPTTPPAVDATTSSPGQPGQTTPPRTGWVPAPEPVIDVVPATGNPARQAHREFQANCSFSHRAPDDPIVFPNLPGASHDHTFLGNTTTNAATTTASLQAGASKCTVPADKSAYWMPTVFNGDQPVIPDFPQVIYYKSGIRDYTAVRPFPTGLRFLAGSATATAAEFRASRGYQAGWECGDSYHNVTFPAHCPAGTQLNVRYQAPSCWDGKHLDSPDHRSHMAYPVDEVCPTSHPVAVPMVEFKMAFPVSGDMSKVRLSSGAASTWHYDFFNAWEPPVLAALVKHCINAGRQCDARGYDQFDPGAGAALGPDFRPRV
jgi:hypothetical protein